MEKLEPKVAVVQQYWKKETVDSVDQQASFVMNF